MEECIVFEKLNEEELEDEGLKELEELIRLEEEGKLEIKEWIIGNRRFNDISNEDIQETFKLFSNDLKDKFNINDKPKIVIECLISFAIGNQFCIEYKDLTKEENKIKSINKYEEKFGKELSNKLKQLNNKYGYDKLEEE
jgi:5-formaminoimidazole-4-carboxamide-1-beta-D-ribofuranosyl 5'-monophosphate synthetase